MSEVVRAAVAARRAAVSAARKTSPNSDTASPEFEARADEADFIQPFASSRKELGKEKPSVEQLDPLQRFNFASLSQKSEEELLLRSCSTGRLNLSSRTPSLRQIPDPVFTLLDGDAPEWYKKQQDDKERRSWYEREDLRVLSIANGEIDQVDQRVGDFRALVRLELRNNSITALPRSTFQLVNLTALNLLKNCFTHFPQSLLALDSLVELDLSHNHLEALWLDAEVVKAREDRQQWEEDNAEEEGGVWAGLIARLGNSSKRARPAPPTASQRSHPLRSLRVLNLSNNRLSNTAVGLPSTNRKSRVGTLADSLVTWPPALVDLDISNNNFCGPFPLSFAGGLKELSKLRLGGNGIGDEVFQFDTQVDAQVKTFARTFFTSLTLLDLTRCEIDDLQKLEGVFGSPKTVFDQEAVASSKSVAKGQSLRPAEGITPRSLVRIASPTVKLPGAQDEDHAQTLALVLEGNPLREENLRRKFRVNRRETVLTLDEKPNVAPTSGSEQKEQPTGAVATPRTSTRLSFNGKTPAFSPSQAKIIVNESCELQAEAGLLTEGGRRRARAEAARREREEASNDSGSGSSSRDTPPPISVGPVRKAARRQKDGINRTGLSDWNSSVASNSARNNGVNEKQQGEQIASASAQSIQTSFTGPDAGSTLANTKLTKRQSEALSRVPCKFFRSSNGCSAGDACPFAHIASGQGNSLGGVKTVCEFFLKGNCRFGHKCALAHLREGEPMSMDRKNKRAAQQGQRGGKRMETHKQIVNPSLQQQGQGQQHSISSMQPLNDGITHSQPWSQRTHSIATADWLTGPYSARDDFAFGVPDDLAGPAISVFSSGISRSLHGNAATLPNVRPPILLSVSDAFVGSPSSRVFGSSPFGQSVFFSGSQEGGHSGSDPFARRSHFRDESFGSSRLGPVIGRAGGGGAEEAVEDDEEHNEEDFLPSSLSDLLTPAELQRRRRSVLSHSGAKSDSLRAKEQTSTQSMPARAGDRSAGFQASLWSLDGIIPAPFGVRAVAALGTTPPSQLSGGSRFLANGSGGFSRSPGIDSQHTPGQSLPQGLPAGLSRLHREPERPRVLFGGTLPAAGSGPGSAWPFTEQGFPGSTPFISTDESVTTPLSSSYRRLGPVGSRNLDDLGPTAPSSILPHRAAGLSSRFASSMFSASLGDPHVAGSFSANLGTSTSPSMLAVGSPPAVHVSGPGIDISSTTTMKQRLDLNRAAPTVPLGGSPRSLPTAKEEAEGEKEEEEEGVFELE